MKRVIIESPYAGDVARNLRYVRACMRDALLRGEAPFASHALYTQVGVLRDEVPDERALGIRAGFTWRAAGELTAVYEDLGVSSGMRLGIEHSQDAGVPVESRALGTTWETPGASHCRRCDSSNVRRRTALEPSGAELPATECLDCEALCLLSPVVAYHRYAQVDQAREALSGQLQLTERRAASQRPPLDPGPCRHCGQERLTRVHLVAGGGHSFEAEA